MRQLSTHVFNIEAYIDHYIISIDRFLIQFRNVHSSFGFMQFLSSLKNSPLCMFFPTIALETINFPPQKTIVNTNYITATIIVVTVGGLKMIACTVLIQKILLAKL
jgi:hypothetical protein